MSAAQLLETLRYVWSVFGIYWVASGLRAKAPATHEAHWYRFLRLSILALVFLLLFWSRAASGFLGARFLPEIPVVAYAGFIATFIGLAIALWARLHLGRYWSDKVVLKVDHQLIRTGPYAHTRHPIYSGVLFAVLGTALVLGEWRGLLAFMTLLVNYSIKAKKEERILAARFISEFREHEADAGFLFPRFRAPR
jgi:protein-S-isoprenylcysteine O-methyltransferase Ste14